MFLIFNALLGNVIPHNTLVISIAFALLAPLGLFRGPLTLFGCGAATLGNPERNRILNSISVCADGHSFYYNECFHLYDTELDRMGSQLRKSINKRTSEKDIAGCMDHLRNYAGNHIYHVWLRRG